MKYYRNIEYQFDMTKAYHNIDINRRKKNWALQNPTDLPLINSNNKNKEMKIFKQIEYFNTGLDKFLI